MYSKNIDGQTFGLLTVLHDVGKDAKNQMLVLCECRCGNTKTVVKSMLLLGRHKSCGCFVFRSFTRKVANTPEHNTYKGMKSRCLNKKDKDYHNYGGRGITVCDRWRYSFKNFLQDMGYKPTPAHSIGRGDNDGNYEPSNCKWETLQEQSNNRRTNVIITYNDTTKTLKEWAKELHISRSALKRRLTLTDTETAFTTPLNQHIKR